MRKNKDVYGWFQARTKIYHADRCVLRFIPFSSSPFLEKNTFILCYYFQLYKWGFYI